MAQAADFFVSYTSADRAWAEWIAWQLEAEGYQVVVQAWDFTPGRDWTHEMQQATVDRRAGGGRPVGRLPAIGARGGGVAGLLRPGPQRRARAAAAGPSRQGRAARAAQDPDLRGPGRPGRGQRPGGAAGRRPRCAGQADPGAGVPWRPAGGWQRYPRRRRFPGELPPIWNVPYHPNPYFIGRDLLLAEIHARLTAPEADGRRVVLTGLGGVGKTQVAIEYAYRQRADYDLVWWIRGDQPTSLLGDYSALAGQPPLVTDLRPAEDASQEALAAAAREWLEHNRRWLLVLDNTAEPAAVTELWRLDVFKAGAIAQRSLVSPQFPRSVGPGARSWNASLGSTLQQLVRSGRHPYQSTSRVRSIVSQGITKRVAANVVVAMDVASWTDCAL